MYLIEGIWGCLFLDAVMELRLLGDGLCPDRLRLRWVGGRGGVCADRDACRTFLRSFCRCCCSFEGVDWAGPHRLPGRSRNRWDDPAPLLKPPTPSSLPPPSSSFSESESEMVKRTRPSMLRRCEALRLRLRRRGLGSHRSLLHLLARRLSCGLLNSIQ